MSLEYSSAHAQCASSSPSTSTSSSPTTSSSASSSSLSARSSPSSIPLIQTKLQKQAKPSSQDKDQQHPSHHQHPTQTQDKVFNRLSRSHTVASIGKIVPPTVRASAAHEKQSECESRLLRHRRSRERNEASPSPHRPSLTSSFAAESEAGSDSDRSCISPPPPYRSRNSSVSESSSPEMTSARSRIPKPLTSNAAMRLPTTQRRSERADRGGLSRLARALGYQEDPENGHIKSRASPEAGESSDGSPDFDSVLQRHRSMYAAPPSAMRIPRSSSPSVHGSESECDTDADEIEIARRLEKRYQNINRRSLHITAEAVAALALTPEFFSSGTENSSGVGMNRQQNSSTATTASTTSTTSSNGSNFSTSPAGRKSSTLERKLRSTLANGDKILEANELALQRLDEYRGSDENDVNGSLLELQARYPVAGGGNAEALAQMMASMESAGGMKDFSALAQMFLLQYQQQQGQQGQQPQLGNGNDGVNNNDASSAPESDLISAMQLLEMEARILESEKQAEIKRLEAERLRIEAELAKRGLLRARDEFNRAKMEASNGIAGVGDGGAAALAAMMMAPALEKSKSFEAAVVAAIGSDADMKYNEEKANVVAGFAALAAVAADGGEDKPPVYTATEDQQKQFVERSLSSRPSEAKPSGNAPSVKTKKSKKKKGTGAGDGWGSGILLP